MNTATKLSGFGLGLAAVFGAAYGVGQVVDPVRRRDQRRRRARPGRPHPGSRTASACAASAPPTHSGTRVISERALKRHDI
ncbi:hypothetical protein D7193_24730 [Micromonospora costi]|uniref:Uncharacterized protein n=1 Tax=Micromonospora costi TaxID=1530042 RepID=A0A3A9ZXU7_9ACTN|nr:hypothetical protein D7193_24730 [Micromonospora costi]